MIEYHSINGVPGFFDCPAGMGLISTLYCADQHKLSNTKNYIAEHRRSQCRFCPIGAVHSGERESENSSRLYGSMMCSRCQRISNRLVGNRICISCYNRQSECKKGKNAKGNPLKLIRHYYAVNILIVRKGTVQIRVTENIMSFQEAIFSILLTEKENIVFGESEGAKFIIHGR